MTGITAHSLDNGISWTTSGGASEAWVTWNNVVYASTTSTTTITATNATWSVWCATSAGTTTVTHRRQPLEPTAEQQRQWAEQEKAKKEASERAEALLRSTLSDEQRRTLDTDNCFYLTSSSGKKYRIDRGRSGNVRLVDEQTGKVLRRYCAHPVEAVPDQDTMLAQKLMLESCEDAFLRIANAS